MVKFPTRRSLLTAGTGGSLAAVAAAFLLRGRPGEPVPEPSSTQPAASASGTGSLRTDLTAHSFYYSAGTSRTASTCPRR